jgi:hypothetical protein
MMSENISELLVLVLAWQEFSQVIAIVPAKVYPLSKRQTLGTTKPSINSHGYNLFHVDHLSNFGQIVTLKSICIAKYVCALPTATAM